MQSKRTRLDRFISAHLKIKRGDVRGLLAQGRLQLDGKPAEAIHQFVDEFTQVECDGRILQANTPVYLMVNKPPGVVSATVDTRHTTVIDLLDTAGLPPLHIVGRLDYGSTGLVLLTNNGRWSRYLTTPASRIYKVYRVTLAKPIDAECVRAFAEGMHFPYENITTRPAKLKVLSACTAEVSLMEGRYHQIKRMFGRFQNPVTSLHRQAVGRLVLDPALAPGESRPLTRQEVELLMPPQQST